MSSFKEQRHPHGSLWPTVGCFQFIRWVTVGLDGGDNDGLPLHNIGKEIKSTPLTPISSN